MRSSSLLRIVSVSAILAAGALGSRNARAEADTFGLGSGRTGAGTISSANAVVNAYESITSNVAVGDRNITVGNGATFAPSDLVLLWQTTGLAVAPASGVQTTIDLGLVSTGTFEYGRVKSILGNVVTLTNPVANAAGYTANTAQIVRVPEYTTLTIAAASSIAPDPWDGAKGGIVVLFANGTVTNNGAIVSDAFGFRGGTLENNNTVFACAANDGPSALGTALGGGAHKGEGLYPADYSPNAASANGTYGRGNITNGGGGGDCSNSGGGGGGHGALGGIGGETWSGEPPVGSRAVGGLGGAALTYDPLARLVFGGGAGAGEENNSNASAGGVGGGVVLMRAAALAGTGTISANGATAANSTNDGAGGGGAGGLVVVRISADATCGGIHANGGNGGDCQTNHGPGGGGSGGVILLQSASGACTTSETAGTAGEDGAAHHRGAADGTVGVTDPPPGGGFLPPACDVAIGDCGGCVLDGDCPVGDTCNSTTNACVAPIPDAGVDSGARDGGSVPPPPTDGGSRSDGGSGKDGGSLNDGGSISNGGDSGTGNSAQNDNDPGDLEGGGCGCSTLGAARDENRMAFGVGVVAALAFLRRKKRRSK